MCPQIFCHLKPPWWVCGSSVLPVFFVPGMTQLDRSPTFLTSDDFIRSKEIIGPKWLIYEVIGHFVLMFWWYHQNIRILAGDWANVDPLIICVCLRKKLQSSIRTFQKCTVLTVIFKTALFFYAFYGTLLINFIFGWNLQNRFTLEDLKEGHWYL